MSFIVSRPLTTSVEPGPYENTNELEEWINEKDKDGYDIKQVVYCIGLENYGSRIGPKFVVIMQFNPDR